jgi:hypothetical protein
MGNGPSAVLMHEPPTFDDFSDLAGVGNSPAEELRHEVDP